eukprot:8098173-Pyramimonas_sp.AAC.1
MRPPAALWTALPTRLPPSYYYHDDAPTATTTPPPPLKTDGARGCCYRRGRPNRTFGHRTFGHF